MAPAFTFEVYMFKNLWRNMWKAAKRSRQGKKGGPGIRSSHYKGGALPAISPVSFLRPEHVPAILQSSSSHANKYGQQCLVADRFPRCNNCAIVFGGICAFLSSVEISFQVEKDIADQGLEGPEAQRACARCTADCDTLDGL